MKGHITTCLVLPKGSNTSLTKSLDPAANLWDIQRREDHAEPYYSSALSKLQTIDHAMGQMLQVLQQINCKEKKRTEEKHFFNGRRE